MDEEIEKSDSKRKIAIPVAVMVLSAIGGLLYRLGGYGAPFNTKVRDFGIPIVMFVTMLYLNGWHWTLILCFGAMFGVQTTYFKKKGSEAKWYNWLFVGIAFSIAMIPYTIQTGHWIGFAFRSFVVTLATVVWSEFVGADWLEESGRGFIQIVTLPLLLV